MSNLFLIAAGFGLVWLLTLIAQATAWMVWLSFGLAAAFLFAGILGRWGRAARQITEERQGTYEWKGETPLTPMSEPSNDSPERAA